MKKLLLITILIFIFATGVQAELLDVVEKDGVLYAGEGWSTTYNGIKVVYYSGTPEEIGQQQGLLVLGVDSKEQQDFFNKMQNQMKTGNYFIDKFRDLYAKYQFIPNFKRHIPDEYLQELKGMIRAVSKGESENIDDFIMANAIQDLGLTMGCSIVSTWGDSTKDGELLVGRNLDHLGFYEMAKYQYLAFYDPEKGNKFVTLNYPANIGLMQGMNDKGLVVAMTYSMVGKEETTINGMPYIIMLRHVLQYATNIDEAINMIKETPRTVGLNIMVASAKDKRAVVLETSASRLKVRRDKNYIYATNRYRTDYMKQFQEGSWIHSELRDKRFKELLNIGNGKIDYRDVIEMMRDKFAKNSPERKGFVAGIENAGTMASLVFRPEKLKLYVSNLSQMPAPEGEYVGFDCSAIWKKGKPVGPVEVINEPVSTSYNENWLRVRKAEFAENRGNKKKVLELLEPVVAEYPEAETPLLLLGVSYIKQKEIGKGLELLKRVTELPEIVYPYNLLRAYYWLGITYDIFLDDREKAIEYYKKTVELPIPDMPDNSGQLKNVASQGLKTPMTIDENGRFVPEK